MKYSYNTYVLDAASDMEKHIENMRGPRSALDGVYLDGVKDGLKKAVKLVREASAKDLDAFREGLDEFFDTWAITTEQKNHLYQVLGIEHDDED